MAGSIPELLAGFAAARPEAPCLTFAEETQSFRELELRSRRLASALRVLGVAHGDRVSILAKNVPAHFELFFACARLGAILLPLNWRLSARELAAIVADGTPTVLFCADEFLPLVAALPAATAVLSLETDYPHLRDTATPDGGELAVDPEAPAVILYTSGTTGLPKGVVICHRNLALVERMAREHWAFTAQSVNLVLMPLFHIGGIGYGMMALSQGGHTVLDSQTAPDKVLELLSHHHVTHAFFVPAVIQLLVDAAEKTTLDLSHLDRILYGASPISETLLKRAMAVFHCSFNHAYGMTETAGTVITLPPEDHDLEGTTTHRLRSCGLPLPWVELALVNPTTGASVATGEVGEIRVRSPMVMLGYWQKPAETAAAVTPDGWLCTGDAAYRDADGYVYIHDRYKDMIISGGENIYPTEVENVLYSHPGVAEVAVVGIPHERWGETPRAYVARRAGSAVSEAELIAYARGQLAHYKCPTSVQFVPALPRNASGKILKRELRQPEWQKANP